MFNSRNTGAEGQPPIGLLAGGGLLPMCLADGASITVILNGVTVNHCIEARPSKGRIQIQSEGAEIFFRRLDLTPLPRAQTKPGAGS